MKATAPGKGGPAAAMLPLMPRNIHPCNFRSAGRLSNESARALSTLHETLARNLVNSLDVYLGTGLEVKLAALEQITMDEFKAASATAGFIVPCILRPSMMTLLIEIDSKLMYTMIDLLLGGPGATLDEPRELTEIDEEIMLGAATLVAKQVEAAWQPATATLTPGTALKPIMAHKAFPPTEKVMRIRFDLSVAGMTGGVYLSFVSSFGSQLVRHIKTDLSGHVGIMLERPSLQQRLLDCYFTLAGVLPDLQVRVGDLTSIEVGTVLKLSAPMTTTGRLTLEEKQLYEAVPVRQSNRKAVQLLALAQPTGWLED